MKKETLKEIGKGFINFGNGVGALSIVNGFSVIILIYRL